MPTPQVPGSPDLELEIFLESKKSPTDAPKRGPRMAFRKGVAECAPPKGIPKGAPKKGSQKGVPKRGSCQEDQIQ